jgi:hypothetical protein
MSTEILANNNNNNNTLFKRRRANGYYIRSVNNYWPLNKRVPHFGEKKNEYIRRHDKDCAHLHYSICKKLALKVQKTCTQT